jgi:hypothetical protein
MGLFDDVLVNQPNQGQQDIFNQPMQDQSMFGQSMPMQDQSMFSQPIQGYQNQGMYGQPMQGGYDNYGYQNQGMYNQPYNQSYGQSMQGYNNYGYQNQNPYGYQGQVGSVDRFGNVKYTRAQIIQGLRDYVMNNSGVMISKEEKIDDTPQLLRHACAEAKISQLGINYFYVPEMGLQIPFYFCTACGKLFYPREVM